MDFIEREKKKRTILYGLLVTVLVFMSVTYAYYRLTKTQTNKNIIATRTCLDTSLTEETSEIVLTDAFPISDEDGLKQTPFTFTLKNNCDSYVKVNIMLVSDYRTSDDTAYLKDDYVKTNFSFKGTTDGAMDILSSFPLGEADVNTEGYILKSMGLTSNEEKSFDLRLWVDSETTIEQGLNKMWSAKVVVTATAAEEPPAAPKGWYEANIGTFLAALRENVSLSKVATVPGSEVSGYTHNDVDSSTASVSTTYQKYYFTYGTGFEANGTKFNLTGAAITSGTYANTYSDLVGKYLVGTSASSNGSSSSSTMKTTTNLSSVYYVVSATANSYTYKQITSNKNTTEAILASTEDDYGTSYYYRGAVKNNYVEFANKCWRIVRITGDGSIKLVLHNDNTSKVSNPCSSANNSTTAAFAHYSGSTYTTTYNSAGTDNMYIGFMYGTKGATSYANSHANTNKSTILTNLETWYKNNLTSYEDVLADTIWCNDKSTSSGLGYGTSTTNYSVYGRLVTSKKPTLICSKDNSGGKLSKFTVDDTSYGNGNLTYKVGLLTADEVAFAGSVYGVYNRSTYLYENGTSVWWTMSPKGYDASYTEVWRVGSGYLNGDSVTSSYALRPSIALVSTVTITGEGTSENPYIVK